MNCAEYKELLVGYVEGLLDETEKRSVAQHLKDCAVCRAELKQTSNLYSRLVNNGKNLAQTNLEDVVLERIIREQNIRLKAASKIGASLNIRRTIMKSPITKLAAAAVIIIAVILGINHFIGPVDVTGVALADVLERVEQVQAFMYKMKMTMTGNMMPGMPAGNQQMQATIIISNDYGWKWEMDTVDPNTGKKTTQQMYILPDQKVILTMMPEMKKYIRMELNDDLLARMKKQNNDPREMIKQILACKYEDLGKSIIDGTEVEGFRTTDPAYMGGAMGENQVDVELWVHSKTWLPVRVEMNIKMGEQAEMQGTIYDFQWNIPVDASEFNPVIPADFTSFTGGSIKMPEISEQAAIGGLRFFAELFGQYPKKLGMMNLMTEYSQKVVALKDSNSPALEQLRLKFKEAGSGSEEEMAKKVMEVMQPIQSLAMFYMTLVQDKKEPVYYGESVAPGEVGSLLLRWKISDSQYRVIFGDLTAADVSADELAELEKALLK